MCRGVGVFFLFLPLQTKRPVFCHHYHHIYAPVMESPGGDVTHDFDLLLGAADSTRDSSAAESSLFDPAVASLPDALGDPSLGTSVTSTQLPPVQLTSSGQASASAATSSATEGTADLGGASRKRPLDDKKAREKKRILRNRELARVSNERRKGRIKAMETELEDTRKTVSNLEESIRTLEAENNDLKALLESKTTALRS